MPLLDGHPLPERIHIAGAWREADDGATLEVLDPARDVVIGRVPRAGAGETRAAIDAAERALPGWRRLTPKQRAAPLRRWYELIERHAEALAHILTAEQGKPLAESRAEIAYGASFVEWFAEEVKRGAGEVLASPTPGKRLLSVREPVGVVAAITPWNFPMAMITRKCAPALAAGCTVVIKPAEQTPFSAIALVRLAEEAGLPPGVLNLVTGDPALIGATLTGDPRVRKLTFTGSTAVGRALFAACAADVKRLSLELGGCAPFVVFADADLDLAAGAALASRFRNAGQTCISANRILVEAPVQAEFLRRFTERVAALRLGPGDAADVDCGPLIDARALARVEAVVEEARAAGARILTGGARAPGPGSFYRPTVVGDLPPGVRLGREEVFGPVAAVQPFADEAEAVRLANATPYGLAAYVYGGDYQRLWRVAEGIEAGMVGLNEVFMTSEVSPFGGYKHSGLGREGAREGLAEFQETKFICFGGMDP